jgi:anti-sigma regulatory factor (Ser/Thr protein kinase)
MHNPSARIILYSSLAIVLLAFFWGLRQIPSEGHLADQALRESLNQEVIVLNGAVKAATNAMKYRLLDVLKAEGNDHVTRTFQDSPFLAASLLEWDQAQWKSLWFSNKSKTDLVNGEMKTWLRDWPLSKLAVDEVYFTKVGDIGGQAYFALLVPVRKPNQVPMIGVGIFPAAQFGLNFSSDENREIRVFTASGTALALSHPAYLGANVKNEPMVHEMLDGEEVSLRHEWKSDAGVRMIGVSSKINDSNLSVAIETKAAGGSRFAAWTYLILCAIGAGIINWVLFSSIFRSVVAQLSVAEERNEALRRQLSEAPRAAGKIISAVVMDPVIPANELGEMDFLDQIANGPLVPTVMAPASVRDEIPAEGRPLEAAAAGKTALGKVVTSAIRALDKKIGENKISVMHFGLDGLAIDGDALQLQTAIEEVLKNAIEAMTESSTRNLTISGREHSTAVRITIEDTGSGIAEGNVEKVFDPFYSTKDSEGVARGLGLNVVRRVIEELEGSVKIHSQAGEGTRVEIEIPLDKHAAMSAEIPEAPPETLDEISLENEDFAIANLPSLPFQEREWPDVAIRKPKVRTLD